MARPQWLPRLLKAARDEVAERPVGCLEGEFIPRDFVRCEPARLRHLGARPRFALGLCTVRDDERRRVALGVGRADESREARLEANLLEGLA